MLSYRHAYHAGNLADVLKHAVLCTVIDAAIKKSAPLLFLDTHAGAGCYDLASREARAYAEHRAGIVRLRAAARDDMPRGVALLLESVGALHEPEPVLHGLEASVNAAGTLRGTLRWYPGSPAIAARLLRPQDRLRLVERHPAEHESLARRFASDERVRVTREDGYAVLAAELPPRERRGIVLIDPGYERDEELRELLDGLDRALARFRHGTFLIWYPCGGKLDPRALARGIERLAAPKTLRMELHPRGNASGEIASGVLVINPPYQSLAPLESTVRFLHHALAPDGAAVHEWLVPENR